MAKKRGSEQISSAMLLPKFFPSHPPGEARGWERALAGGLRQGSGRAACHIPRAGGARCLGSPGHPRPSSGVKGIAGSLHLHRRLRAGDLGSVRGPVVLGSQADPVHCRVPIIVGAFHELLWAAVRAGAALRGYVRRSELISFRGRRNSRAVVPSVLLHRFPCCLPLRFSAQI